MVGLITCAGAASQLATLYTNVDPDAVERL